MKTTIDATQAIALNELGLDAVECSTIAGLLNISASPNEGENTSIRADMNGTWAIFYDNAGGGRFHTEYKDLIDALVEFTIWKAMIWPSLLNVNGL